MPRPRRPPSPPPRRRSSHRDAARDSPRDGHDSGTQTPTATPSPTTGAAAPSQSAIPLSLQALLASARHAKAAPPESLRLAGVVCLPPAAMQALSLRLLDVVTVHLLPSSVPAPPEADPDTAAEAAAAAAAAACAWPLDAVPQGFVALDDQTLAALAVTPAAPPRPRAANAPATPPAHHRSKRKNSSRARRASAPAAPIPPPASPGRTAGRPSDVSSSCGTPLIRIERVGAEVPEAHAVHLVAADLRPKPARNDTPRQASSLGREAGKEQDSDSDDDDDDSGSDSDGGSDFEQGPAPLPVDDDVLCATLRRSLHGRLLRVGSTVRAPVLGEPRVLRVALLRAGAPLRDIDVARVARGTLVSLPRAEDEPGKERLSARLAGVDAQYRELEAAVSAALQPQPQSGGQRSDALRLDALHDVSRHAPGALLRGVSGTGKTLLACAVAQASGAAIELVTAASTAARGGTPGEDGVTRALERAFATARRRQPCVLLLDDVEAVAPRRDAPDVDTARAAGTAALLTLLDGVSCRGDAVFVIGTTAHAQQLDPAVRRAGRLELDIELPVPDARARAAILAACAGTAAANGRLAASAGELDEIARVAYGFVGADLAAAWRFAAARAQQRCAGTDAEAAVTSEDVRAGVRSTRPSALRGVSVEVATTRWADVGGMADAKRRLQEAVEWPLSLHGAARLRAAGVRAPRGILLYGPPGCSKTLLARAVATEGGANFIAVKGAELLSKWVGESERAVQATFRRARQAAPCVIFFDEVDALAPARGSDGAGGSSAQARVVAQLLAEMDGVHRADDDGDAENRVVVIAATNRPDCLDAAFLRPGRIDVQVYVSLPDESDRRDILRVHARNVPLAADVDLDAMASDKVTSGFSGAELAALVREAALHAMMRDVENADRVDASDFDAALQSVRPRTPRDLLTYFERYNAGLRARVR